MASQSSLDTSALRAEPGAPQPAEAAAHALDRENYVPAYLARLAGRMSGGASRVYLRNYAIGVNEWRILSILTIEPQATAQLISEAIDIDKAATSRSIKTLVSRGHVRAADPACSQRNRPFVLTPEGAILHDKILTIATDRERILLDGFGPEERAMLLWMFRRLTQNLGKVEAYDSAALGVRGV